MRQSGVRVQLMSRNTHINYMLNKSHLNIIIDTQGQIVEARSIKKCLTEMKLLYGKLLRQYDYLISQF